MAGRMGGRQVTALNLQIVSADAERELVLVKGAIPGARGGMVVLRDSVKSPGPRWAGPDEHRHGTYRLAGLRSPVRKERPAPEARSVDRRDITGAVLGTVDLEPTVFGLVPNAAVLHQVVTAQLAAARAGTQSTKTRAEVRGGGAKPFRQKGTGRARQGSTRAPNWSGGGIALGPKPRSYRQRTPKKMVRLALRSALSDRAASDQVVRWTGGRGRRPGPRVRWRRWAPWA